MNIPKKIKEKLFFIIILSENLVINNFGINCILVFIIVYSYYFTDRAFLGPIFSAFLTFNLINGYSLYNKLKNWNSIKEIVLFDIWIFIISFINCLGYKECPIQEEDSKEHEIVDEQVSKLFGNTHINLDSALNKYEDYFNMVLKKDIKLVCNDKNMNHFIFTFDYNQDKVNNSILSATIIFPENFNMLKKLAHFKTMLSNVIGLFKGYAIFQSEWDFLHNIIFFIEEVKKITILFKEGMYNDYKP